MLLLVGNPSSQSGRNAERIALARALMERHGIANALLPTRPDGLTVLDVAERLRGGGYEAVVAMGGDGTFADVAKGLMLSGTQIPMGLLPTGTANNNGRSVGLSADPADLERNVMTLKEGTPAPFDAGHVAAFDVLDRHVASDWFFDSMGWGISARILRMRNEDRRLVAGVPILRELYRDRVVFVGAVARAFLESWVGDQQFEAEVTTEHGTVFLEHVTDLIVNNTRYYASAWVFDPTSSHEDGEMELVPFRGQQEWIARCAVSIDGLPPVDDTLPEMSPIVRARRFEVRLLERAGADPVETQLDGEQWAGATRWDIEVVRHAIHLLVPG